MPVKLAVELNVVVCDAVADMVALGLQVPLSELVREEETEIDSVGVQLAVILVVVVAEAVGLELADPLAVAEALLARDEQ